MVGPADAVEKHLNPLIPVTPEPQRLVAEELHLKIAQCNRNDVAALVWFVHARRTIR